MWWAGKDRVWGSISDSFNSFDDAFVGDAGPVSRSIGSGPVDKVGWLLPLQRMLLGAVAKIYSARSTSLDEPLTALNINIKSVSTQGSAQINGLAVDTSGVFVQQSGIRAYVPA